MIIPTNPKKLNLSPAKGCVLDVHTISSMPTGVNEFGHTTFDTVRSELGEALYELKYHRNLSQVEDIAETVAELLKKWKIAANFDLIIPVPPSVVRRFQPVSAIAKRIGKKAGIPFSGSDLVKHKVTSPMKDTKWSKKERLEILADAFSVDTDNLEDKDILLIDDLIGTGATLKTIIDTLYNRGRVNSVTAIVLTRTKANF